MASGQMAAGVRALEMTSADHSAEGHKGRGNDLFSAGKYIEAVEEYTKACEIDAQNSPCWSNLSFTFYKLGDYEQALYSAQRAVESNPAFLKGYYRRALAKRKLCRVKEAKADLLLLLQHNASDDMVRKELAECDKIIREQAFKEAIRVQWIELTAEYIASVPVPPEYDGPVVAESTLSITLVKEIIARFKSDRLIDRRSALAILYHAKNILAAEKTLMHIGVASGQKMTVCGDVHGQFFDLVRIFEEVSGFPSPDHLYLFNGDFVDRGPYSVEVMLTLLSFKVLYPQQFYLSRGNHEFADLNKAYGFEAEVLKKYDATMFSFFCEVFNQLPIAFVINGDTFVCHGGIPIEPDVTLKDIEAIDRIHDRTPNGLMQQLLWSDPSPAQGHRPSIRGCAFQFGPDITHDFLVRNGLKKVIRSHEFKTTGYEVMHDDRLVTLFSAPCYHDMQYSLGAVIEMGSDCVFKFKRFDAAPHRGKLGKPLPPTTMAQLGHNPTCL